MSKLIIVRFTSFVFNTIVYYNDYGSKTDKSCDRMFGFFVMSELSRSYVVAWSGSEGRVRSLINKWKSGASSNSSTFWIFIDSVTIWLIYKRTGSTISITLYIHDESLNLSFLYWKPAFPKVTVLYFEIDSFPSSLNRMLYWSGLGIILSYLLSIKSGSTQSYKAFHKQFLASKNNLSFEFLLFIHIFLVPVP